MIPDLTLVFLILAIDLAHWKLESIGVSMQTFNLDNFLKRQGISLTHNTKMLWDTLKQYATEDTWLAGGAVMSLVKGYVHKSDYDFFFGGRASLDNFYNNLLEIGAVETFRTPNAVTMTYGDAKIQLVGKKFYTSPEAIIADFDLTISMFVLSDTTLYCGDYSLMDLANRELRVEYVNALGYTIKRLFKFGQRGYRITPQAYTKIMEFFTVNPQLDLHITRAIEELNSTNIAPVIATTTATPTFTTASQQVGTIFNSNY